MVRDRQVDRLSWGRLFAGVALVVLDFSQRARLGQPALHQLWGRRLRVAVGGLARTGSHAEPITHYSVPVTIEAAYALRRDGKAATATPITDIWRP